MIKGRNKIIRLSIGIPAYNEERNIQKLLKSILKQKEKSFAISEVIVVCDGSTDKTVSAIKEIKDSRIKLIYDKKRLGKSARLNQILKKFTGDILFLMDADIVIKDLKIFEKIMVSVDLSKAGLVGVAATPLPSTATFQKIVNTGVDVMNDIANNWNGGVNYLAFKGCFLGLDKKLAKESKLENKLVNNDAYFYFKAVELGYSPKRLNNVAIYYISPKTFKDHLNQSSRYRNSREELQKYFSLDLSQEYNTPLSISLSSTLRYLVKRPIYLSAYIVVRIVTKLAREKRTSNLWEVAFSTKK